MFVSARRRRPRSSALILNWGDDCWVISGKRLMSIDIARAHRPFISSPLGLIMHKTLLLLGVCVCVCVLVFFIKSCTRVTLVLTLFYTCQLSPYAPCAHCLLSYGSLRVSSLLLYIHGVQSGRGSYQQYKLIACVLFQKFKNEKRFGIKKKSPNVSSKT
jgi:hypothetical protein